MAQPGGATLDYTITLHDPKNDTDEQVAERVAFSNIISAEVTPDDPPMPVAEAIAALRSSPERIRRWSFRARDSKGQLAGMAGTGIDPEHDENPDMLWTGVNLLPEHRRHGLGTRLFAEIVKLAEAEGRTRLLGGTNDRLPTGDAFAEAIGAEVKSRMHLNRLLVADVDRAMLQQWVDDGPTRAAGYELFGWDGPVADEYLEKYVDLVHVMNDAPRDDIEMNDFKLTPEQVREGEKQMAAMGGQHWTVVVRRVEDDAWAGFHDMTWFPFEPNFMNVGATGVLPAHRGHAIGKWLKAHIMLRVLDEKPDVTEIRTGNADSNDAMLGINHLMGYRPWIGSAVYEISVEQARAWLEQRGALEPR